jgi:hypothetical protein
MPQLHRNNAAEWVMLIALSPFILLAQICRVAVAPKGHVFSFRRKKA